MSLFTNEVTEPTEVASSYFQLVRSRLGNRIRSDAGLGVGEVVIGGWEPGEPQGRCLPNPTRP